ncbi:MAG: hypothetical protein AB1422_02445 [bacterium]
MMVIRWIVSGVVVAIISQVVGFVIYGLIFGKFCAMSEGIWRPMTDICWSVGMPLTDLLAGLMFALGYLLLYKGIPGKGINKGFTFGLIVWLMARVPGELYFYTMIPIHRMLVFAGWLQGLLSLCLGGLVIAALYGKTLEEK